MRLVSPALFAFVLCVTTGVAAQPDTRMGTARVGHAAARLADGRVLVAGGQDGDGDALASAEIFDGRRWAATTPMGTARAGLTLTVLADGRVLAVGGHAARRAVTNVEVYDPSSATWTTASAMRHPRGGHVAVRLTDGRVLVAGGFTDPSHQQFAAAETYDVAANSWSPAGMMIGSRSSGSAALLGDGRVLVSGSFTASLRSDTLDLFDPRTSTWSTVSPSLGALEAVVALPDGRALVLGHRRPSRYVADSRSAAAAIFDPTTSSFSDAGTAGSQPWPRYAAVVARSDGTVVVASGMHWRFASRAAREQAIREACEGLHVPLRSTREVWRWSAGRWSRRPDLVQPRTRTAAVLLDDGTTVLITGGELFSYGFGSTLVRRSVDIVR